MSKRFSGRIISWEQKANELKAENKALKEELDELSDSASNFLLRVDELTPHIRGDRVVAHNHGIKWTHGNWVSEKKTLWRAIKKSETLIKEKK